MGILWHRLRWPAAGVAIALVTFGVWMTFQGRMVSDGVANLDSVSVSGDRTMRFDTGDVRNQMAGAIEASLPSKCSRGGFLGLGPPTVSWGHTVVLTITGSGATISDTTTGDTWSGDPVVTWDKDHINDPPRRGTITGDLRNPRDRSIVHVSGDWACSWF